MSQSRTFAAWVAIADKPDYSGMQRPAEVIEVADRSAVIVMAKEYAKKLPQLIHLVIRKAPRHNAAFFMTGVVSLLSRPRSC
jgi:hypothetical protein